MLDGCQYTTGNPQEYKGHYEDLMAKDFFTKGPLRDDFLTQAEAQLSANTAANILNGRINTIDWHFDERQTADYAWRVFEEKGYLGSGRIRVHYTPYSEMTDEPYPDPEQ